MNVNNIFVDTNVLIGYYADKQLDIRALNYLYSLRGKRLYTSTLAVAQLVSTFQKRKTNAEIKEIVKYIQTKFSLLSFVDEDVTKALKLATADIEDNIQYVISSKMKCFYFITNNIKDYKDFTNIEVLNSKEIRNMPY